MSVEVKMSGKYKMRNGELAEVYGFDDLGTDVVYAEGFDLKGRHMKHWDCNTGKLASSWAKSTPDADQYDIVERLAPGETK